MKKSRFSEAQIVGILKEVEMGAKVAETCRKHGVSEPTYYKWKSQFSGMTVSHLAQLRQLQDENAKLKRMYADLALMHHALKDTVDRKLWPRSEVRRSFKTLWPSKARASDVPTRPAASPTPRCVTGGSHPTFPGLSPSSGPTWCWTHPLSTV